MDNHNESAVTLIRQLRSVTKLLYGITDTVTALFGVDAAALAPGKSEAQPEPNAPEQIPEPPGTPPSDSAAALFAETEGVDIYSAAGVALASLANTVAAGKIDRDATIMLNITGGGEEHFKAGKELWYLKPAHIFSLEPTEEEVEEKVQTLFQ